uniref:Uncharacterized protein n=1 Tax=Anguilla anguilla TaxID=7936 RepID=A0A0E9TG64_ANGAN
MYFLRVGGKNLTVANIKRNFSKVCTQHQK